MLVCRIIVVVLLVRVDVVSFGCTSRITITSSITTTQWIFSRILRWYVTTICGRCHCCDVDANGGGSSSSTNASTIHSYRNAPPEREHSMEDSYSRSNTYGYPYSHSTLYVPNEDLSQKYSEGTNRGVSTTSILGDTYGIHDGLKRNGFGRCGSFCSTDSHTFHFDPDLQSRDELGIFCTSTIHTYILPSLLMLVEYICVNICVAFHHGDNVGSWDWLLSLVATTYTLSRY